VARQAHVTGHIPSGKPAQVGKVTSARQPDSASRKADHRHTINSYGRSEHMKYGVE
jgi:hypothetical protein